jgi:4,5-dihydroxyphthalate decarboxylase
MNARGQQQILKNRSSCDLALTLAIAEYDRTLPIISGRVKPQGITLGVTTSFAIGDFCHVPIYEQFDLAEMSLSMYVAARCRNEPVIAIPVFPLRMPVLAYLFCRSDAAYAGPLDLKGKRIAVRQYRMTVNLWTRGLFKDRYGITPEQLRWVTREPEGAAYSVPSGIEVEVAGRTAEDVLLAGKADAMVGATVPQSFLAGDPRIRRLYPDARAEMRKYVAETGFMPTTHVVVMKQSLAKDKPWVAQSMVRAFQQSQQVCSELNLEPKRHSDPDAVFALEEQARVYGDGIWNHGFEANRKVVEAFVRYAHEQGYIARRPAAEEFFVPGTLDL